MKSFSFHDRKKMINDLKLGHHDFDLVVIGGGINGAGVARDAALRGMRVALIEARDFASGTSSRSSKLIHGGIRYLENLEFHLVFEALNERHKLFAMAPHLVHPLRFLLPLYKGGRVGMFKMGLGMWLYDALSLFQAPELHERLNTEETINKFPSLQKDKLLGAYLYSDAYMDDDRLVHETLRSANEAGAICVNYVEALKPIVDETGSVTGVLAQDALSGEQISIYGQHVVSTVGPWTDELGGRFFKDWERKLRPTKGIHLTFEKSRFPLNSAVVMAAESRIVFAIPRHEMVIVGTTDTDFEGDPAAVHSDADDVRYLLGVIGKYFPGAKIEAKDIVGSYAGVRPLVHDGSQSEGKTSREHTIYTNHQGLTFVMGGKYTTYRLIAEQVVEEALRYFPFEDRARFARSHSEEPLNLAVTEDTFRELPAMQKHIRELTSLSEIEAQWLVERHGAEAFDIVNLKPQDSYWMLETRHAILNTMCMNLLDFYRRRVPLTLSDSGHGFAVLNDVKEVFAEMFGLSARDLEAQEKELRDFLKNEHSWQKTFDMTKS